MPTLANPEQRLLHRASVGDRRAFDRLFSLHQDTIRRCLSPLLDRDDEQIEEAIGVVFLNAFLALPRFRREAAFSTWLFRIAQREACARRRLAAQERHRQTILSSTKGILPAPILSDPEESFLETEERERLRQALRALPEPYRTPVMLRHLEALSSVEIARRLKRPEGTVRHQISRGLQILRQRVGETDRTSKPIA